MSHHTNDSQNTNNSQKPVFLKKTAFCDFAGFDRQRRGLTLAELLVASTVMTLVVAALGVFTEAVMDGWDVASHTGNAAQAGRVVLARIAHKVATSRRVLKVSSSSSSLPGKLILSEEPSLTSTTTLTTGPTMTSTTTSTTSRDQFLLVWERDGEPDDPTPGQPNFVELVIYAPHKTQPAQLLELRPQVDPALIVPTDQPDLLYIWIDRFRSGKDVEQPPTVLLNELGGIRFNLEEFADAQGIAGVVQQNIRVSLCVSPVNQQPAVFFGSATRRYVP